MNRRYSALRKLFALILVCFILPSASSAGRVQARTVQGTNMPTAAGYFHSPAGPSCVGGGCTSPNGYNTISNSVNLQALLAYDSSSGSVFGGGRVETTIRVGGAGIGTVRIYYALSGVSCSAGHSLDIAKVSGNTNNPNPPLAGYLDVTLTASDQGGFKIYTRCKTAGAYVGYFGITSLWYSFLPCYGDTCNGLNPNTMGCDSDAQSYPEFKELYNSSNIVIGRVENRFSAICLAQWERTRNYLGTSMYAEGSIRWGYVDYSSGINPVNGYVAHEQNVYTAMYATSAGFGASLNCGSLSTSPVTPPPQPINLQSSYGLNNCFVR